MLQSRHRIPDVALPLIGGLAWSACFNAESLPALAWVAMVPLILAIDSDRPWLHGWLFGLAAWLPATHWVATTLETYGPLHPVLAKTLWIALCAFFALECLAFVALARLLTGRHTAGKLSLGWSEAHRLWILPSIWLLLEAQRGFMVNGFPWNLAAHAWIDLPGALALAPWIGAWGLSFLVVGVNVAAAVAWRKSSWTPLLGGWSVALALLAPAQLLAPTGDSDHSSKGTAPGSESASEPIAIRVVQPNSGISFESEAVMANYERLIQLTREACDAPALVIWPESAAWPFIWDDSPRLRRDVQMIHRMGCPVVLSSPRRRQDSVFNTTLLTYGDGRDPAEYAKRRLVPWGEYVPLADLFPFIGHLARNAGQFTPGTEVGLMSLRGQSLAMAICYEVIFAGLTAEQCRAGADILLTVTNDAWYGDTSAPWQHLRAARFRAAENRKPMLRAALTGVSAIIDSKGKVVEQLGVGETGILRGEVVGSSTLTPYAQAPWWPVWTSVALLAFAMIRGLRSGGSESSPAHPASPEPSPTD